MNERALFSPLREVAVLPPPAPCSGHACHKRRKKWKNTLKIQKLFPTDIQTARGAWCVVAWVNPNPNPNTNTNPNTNPNVPPFPSRPGSILLRIFGSPHSAWPLCASLPDTHTHTHTHTQSNTAHTSTHKHTQTHTHTQSNTAHTNTHTHTHTRTHTNTNTHTHTHTHKCTQAQTFLLVI